MSISVIIPVKNRADLISDTLNSILNQSRPPHEIILVDDASTDTLKQVIEPYGERITYLKSRGQGPGAARNTGLAHARGEYIQFFDSDDIMSVNKLEVQASLLENNSDAGFVYGPYVAAREVEHQWFASDVIMQYFPLSQRPLQHMIAEGWCAITQSCLFDRKVIEKAGLWREDLMTHEDKEYWY
ncbi:MAG: glycosyltransferase family 2 protein, partial [Cytophagales bacterium]|nr:glycosyltransferase family 2 protein [Cytophaga sp.]